MKQEQLLFGPFAEDLPNFALVDIDGKPTTRIDFAEGNRRPRIALGHGAAHLLRRWRQARRRRRSR